MAAKKKQTEKSKTTLAKQDDGSIQITFSIDWKEIEPARKKVIEDMSALVTVPGFRKGKAPLEHAIKHLSEEKVVENTLSKILPKLFSEIIEKEKIKPAIYPKFELLHAHEGEDWSIRAITCELPEIKLKEDHKKFVKKLKVDKKAEKQEKENKVVDAVIENTESTIPEILVEEEVNSRLSSLLQRIDNLGLNLDNYLSSIGKTAQELRDEYMDQAAKAIKLDLALQEIADKEKITVDKKEIDEYLKVVPNATGSASERATVEIFLRKRKTLDHLVSLL